MRIRPIPTLFSMFVLLTVLLSPLSTLGQNTDTRVFLDIFVTQNFYSVNGAGTGVLTITNINPYSTGALQYRYTFRINFNATVGSITGYTTRACSYISDADAG